MAKLWYGHFDSTEDDPRLLLAEDWANYIKSFITDGIRNGGNTLKITAGSGMKVLMDEGIANIQGYIFQSEADNDGRYFEINVDTAHPSLPRIDRVVLRLDRSIEVRTITPMVILGTANANPVAPALTRDGVIWDLCLAQIRVDAGAVAITSAKITDMRFNTDLCGVMNSVLGLDPSSWQKEFDDFLAAIKAENTAFLSQRLTQFNNQLASQQTTWQAQTNSQKNAWDEWFATIKIDLATYATFDFDNLSALTGVTRTTTFTGASEVNEVLKTTVGNVTVATRKTVFNANGSITTTEDVYQSDGVAILRHSVVTTTFNADSSITEVMN